MSGAGADPVRLRGRGAVRLPAYGVADAEHRVEKELLRLLPAARVAVTSIARVEPEPRIVEEFEAEYRLEMEISVPPEAEDPRGAAFRAARAALAGSRYAATAWELGERGGRGERSSA